MVSELSTRAHLLVFDEATSSLDSLTEEEISRTMRAVATTSHVCSRSLAAVLQP
jgi:ABC-type multidrug transport system fused ATPase/permease subunit